MLLPILLLTATLGLGTAMVAIRIRSGWTPAARRCAKLLLGVAVFAPAGGIASTVLQLVLAFRDVEKVNPADKATILAAGISEAMNSTAFGLLLALPAAGFGLWGFIASSRKKAPPNS